MQTVPEEISVSTRSIQTDTVTAEAEAFIKEIYIYKFERDFSNNGIIYKYAYHINASKGHCEAPF